MKNGPGPATLAQKKRHSATAKDSCEDFFALAGAVFSFANQAWACRPPALIFFCPTSRFPHTSSLFFQKKKKNDV